jgi:hypothetical protein
MKMLDKYYMTINGAEYNALFADPFEAADFLDVNDADGNVTIINRIQSMTPQEALDDPEFDTGYKAEVVAAVLIPNHRQYTKSEQLIDLLKGLGYQL